MKTKWMLIGIGALSAIALAAPPAHSADLTPMVVNIIRGELNVQQHIPCGNVAGATAPVTVGRLEVAPADGVDVPGGKRFVLTRASVSFTPFSLSGSCAGHSETRHYQEVGVQLGQAVAFTATPTATAGVFAVLIPRDDVLIAEGTRVDGTSEAGFKRPSQDVIGFIDLVHHTIQVTVVLATRIHVDIPVIGGDFDGTLTATLFGTRIFPDADGDGIPDSQDTCPLVANPDQKPVTSPIITAPADVIVASCAERSIGFATAKDVCGGGPVTVMNNALAAFRPGPNLVTWTAADATGRYVTIPQTVTVADTTPPLFTLVPPATTLNSCGGANLGVPKALDDCAGAPTITNNAPASFGVGTTTVTWTARDLAGNLTTATQTVTVTDLTAPKIACASVADPTGLGGAGYFRVGAADACTAAPAIQLGGFTLANGETLQITPSLKPGVTLIGVSGLRRVRHFAAGPGENVINATDASGNVASAACGASQPGKW